jgi:hypothetical protein
VPGGPPPPVAIGSAAWGPGVLGGEPGGGRAVGGFATVPSGVCDAMGIQSRTSPFGDTVVATIRASGGRNLPPGLQGSVEDGELALGAAGAHPVADSVRATSPHLKTVRVGSMRMIDTTSLRAQSYTAFFLERQFLGQLRRSTFRSLDGAIAPLDIIGFLGKRVPPALSPLVPVARSSADGWNDWRAALGAREVCGGLG